MQNLFCLFVSVSFTFFLVNEISGCFSGNSGNHDFHIQQASNKDFTGVQKKREKGSDGYANDNEFDIFGEIRLRKVDDKLKENKNKDAAYEISAADSLLVSARISKDSDDTSLEFSESRKAGHKSSDSTGSHAEGGQQETQFWHLKSLQDIEERQRSTQCIWNGHTCMTDEHCCSLFCKQDFKGTRTCTMPVIDPYQVHESDTAAETAEKVNADSRK